MELDRLSVKHLLAILVALHENPGSTTYELIDDLAMRTNMPRIPYSTLSRVSSQFETEEILKSTIDQQDPTGRLRRFTLTEKGEALYDQAVERIRALHAMI